MIDPEAFEPTEEQFASSVSADLEPDAHHHARLRYLPSAAGHEAAAPVRTGIERELGERATLESGLQAKADVWRQEVADRVEGYRTKRSKKRLAGEFSMKLDFGPPIYTSAVPVPELEALEFADDRLDDAIAEVVPEEMVGNDDAEDGSENDGAPHLRIRCDLAMNADLAPEASDPGPAAPALAEAELPWERVAPEPAPVKRPAPRTPKLIEFPRLAIFPEFEDPYALAEPVLDKPRILDVPEEVPTEPQPFSDVELGPDEEEETAQPAIELPLQVAAVPQRLMAAFVDMALSLQATAIFAAIVFWFGVNVPHTKPVLGIAATIPVLFWALYQYLFLVYAAATPGMKMAHLVLSTFDGAPVPRRLRRLRALMLVLSGLSLALGFIWAFFDEDTLCWHDKMTRTYLTMR